MASLNIPVLAAGNIGVPVISLFDNPPSPDTVCVLETSSYQAADVEVSPDIGVLTSLFPEHLNWHGDLQRYYADKRNLFVHRTDAVTVVSATGGDAPLVGRDLPGTVKWFDSPETLHVQDTRIVRGDSLVLDASASPLLGAHNLSNLAGTLTVLEAYGIDLVANRAALENALAAFSPLPHRLERIATAGGVQFVDDGLATNPHAAIAAIQSFPGLFVTLLVGGQDRGVDYTPLVDALLDRAEPTAVVGIPDNGNRVVSELRARADSRGLKVTEHLYDEDSLESAVRRAAGITPAGGVVLLAPAAPSFGRFRDYLERSAVFLQAVADL
jgi:UDP-N-acetylmuramoylalanine--D-glutamate ligase